MPTTAANPTTLRATEPQRANELRRQATGVAAKRRRANAHDPIRNSTRRFIADCTWTRTRRSFAAESTAAATAPQWKDWRAAMNAATRGQNAIGHARDGRHSLARQRRAHSRQERCATNPNLTRTCSVTGPTPTIGPNGTLKWLKAGDYEIEIQQGCGKGSGGAEVAIEIGGQTLKFTVQETGHFQHMIQRIIGEVKLDARQTHARSEAAFETRRRRHGLAARCAATGAVK